MGGGDSREIDRLRANSWCACFEWESARCGRAGTSELEMLELLPNERAEPTVPTDVTERFDIFDSKNDDGWECSDAIGDDSMEETSGVVIGLSRKLLEM